MERAQIEKEISDKAKEWLEDYGEDFLLELIDVYLEDTPARLVRLGLAVAGGDVESLTREGHTLKSSSANVGAMTLSALARHIEHAGRDGTTESLAADIQRMAAAFAQVKATLQALRPAPGTYVGQER